MPNYYDNLLVLL